MQKDEAKAGRFENIRCCIGCLQGCEGQLLAGCAGSCLVNLRVAREYENPMDMTNTPRKVMNNGIDMTSGKRFVRDYGNFRDMETFDDIMKAWDGAIRELTRASVIVENAIDIASEKEVSDILCSCLTQDCLGRGKTIKEGGAVYDFISGLQVGIANMADSLSAIKKLVYEEKKISKDELMKALSTDFTGQEGERIRQMLIHEAPKYGNDDDYADQLVVDAYASYLDEIKKYPNTRCGRGPIGGIRYGGTSSICFKAVFTNMELIDCVWKAHDGQQPD